MDTKTKIIFTSIDCSIKEAALSLAAISFRDKPFKIEKLLEEILKVFRI